MASTASYRDRFTFYNYLIFGFSDKEDKMFRNWMIKFLEHNIFLIFCEYNISSYYNFLFYSFAPYTRNKNFREFTWLHLVLHKWKIHRPHDKPHQFGMLYPAVPYEDM
jgi:hypothetical protein